jgi:RNA polymerase sigma factor (sigma-70 family)
VATIGSDTDSSLIAAAVAGDREAFAQLLERHYDRIHGLAWQLTGSRADADDIAQDVCCILVEKIGTYRGDAKFTTWLHGVTFNACRIFTPAVREAALSRGSYEITSRDGGKLRGGGRIWFGCGLRTCSSDETIRIREVRP